MTAKEGNLITYPKTVAQHKMLYCMCYTVSLQKHLRSEWGKREDEMG